MRFESVAGMASIYVEQDFLAQIYVYNMIEDVRHSAEEKIQKHTDKYMYPQRINQNVAIGIFKDELLDMALEENNSIRIRKLKKTTIRNFKIYLTRPEVEIKKKTV